MTALLIVLYILAGSFVLVGVVGGSGMQLEKISIPSIPQVARIVALTFGTILFAIALYFTVITTLPGTNLRGSPELPDERSATQRATTTTRADEQPDTSTTRVAFTTPRDGDQVNRTQEIAGTAFNISPGRHLWIVVYSVKAAEYRPQAGPVEPNPSNKMFKVEGNFGDVKKTEPGAGFSIIAVVASEAENEDLISYRNKDNPKEGLAKLIGTKVGEISVTRR